jgi:hypothetical protein
VRPFVAGLATAALLLVLGLFSPPARSGANFTDSRTNAGNSVTADTVTRFLSLWSQGTDPAGLTGYAMKNLASPPVPAATGANTGLSLDLGGWKNGGTMNRVFTIQAPASLPASSITVTAIVPATPLQPVSTATIANVGSTGGTTSVTLTAGAKRQVNFTIVKLPGNNVLYTAIVQLKVTFPGYTGDFYTYSVPVRAWDGNGSGP